MRQDRYRSTISVGSFEIAGDGKMQKMKYLFLLILLVCAGGCAKDEVKVSKMEWPSNFRIKSSTVPVEVSTGPVYSKVRFVYESN